MWDQENRLAAVEVEAFFGGNEDQWSIGSNLQPHPGLAAFERTLLDIRKRPGVQDVLVEIDDCPSPDEPLDADVWCHSDAVFIVSSAPIHEVQEWISALRPDLVHEGWNVEDGIVTPILDRDLNQGMVVYRVWWD